MAILAGISQFIGTSMPLMPIWPLIGGSISVNLHSKYNIYSFASYACSNYIL